MFRTILDAVFPVHCVGGCYPYDTWLCRDCIRQVANPFCTPLRQSSPDTSIDIMYGLGVYQTPLLQRAIHTLKYRKIPQVGIALGNHMKDILEVSQYDICVPIPLHAKKLKQRGFNQSQIIAEQLGIPVRAPLQRVMHTTAQATLNRAQRLVNMQNAFALTPGYSSLHGARILLVDDVYTTGATTQSAASVLRTAGAAYVDVAVIAVD